MTKLGFVQLSADVLNRWDNSVAKKVIVAMSELTYYVTVGAILAMITLMLVRFIMNYADMNPFSRPVIWVRRLTDPFINPVRRALGGFGIQPNGAPLITILLTILIGFFVMMLVHSLLNMAAGIYVSVLSLPRGLVALLGYVLYGLLSLYSLLILMRIVFSWGRVSYVNRVMRFLINTTDPILMPLRQTIPPLGMFDISPIFAFLIIWLLQIAIVMTLLRGWPPAFVT